MTKNIIYTLLITFCLLFNNCSHKNDKSLQENNLVSLNSKDEIMDLEVTNDSGNLESIKYLAEMHYVGSWLEQDYKEAYKLYKISAENGDTESQYNIAVMNLNALGVEQNYQEAFKWFKK